MAYILVSYAPHDRAWAEWIGWQIEEAGYDADVRAWDIRPGHNLTHELQRGLNQAERTIAVLSPAYLESADGQAEWHAAFRADASGEDRRLIPVKIEPVDAIGILGHIAPIDLFDLDEDTARHRLLDGLTERRAKPLAKPAFPPTAHSEKPAFPGLHLSEWKEFVESCARRSRREIRHRIAHKFIPELYVPRTLDRLFANYLQGEKPCFLVVDKAGSGKTNLVCHLTLAHAADHPVVFLPGKIPLASVADLERELFRRLGFDSKDPALEALLEMTQALNRPVLVFIDGINENDHREYMREGLVQLLLEAEPRRFRFVITCRDLFWSFFAREGSVWKDHAFIEPSTQQHNLRLQELAPKEFEEAKKKYFSYFNLSGNLLTEAKVKCHHPLLLRFFCEAHGRAEHERQREGILGTAEDQQYHLGDVPDIRLKTLFDLYWNRKIERIKELDPRIRSPRIIESFLYSVAARMRQDQAKALSRGKVASTTGYNDHALFDSVYTRIYDEDIIFEEETSLALVTFVYDEFMEYTMARQLYKQELGWHAESGSSIAAQIRELIAANSGYQHIDNIAEYLLLWLEDDRDPTHLEVMDDLAGDDDARLSKVLCNCCPKLKTIDKRVMGLLDRLSRSDHQGVRHSVAEAVGRVLHRQPRHAYSLITRLSKDEGHVQYGAVLGLGHQGDARPQETAKILRRLICSTDPQVRRSVAGFYRSDVGKQLPTKALQDLKTLGRDDDEIVRLESLESMTELFADMPEQVLKAMKALEDPWVCRRACEYLTTADGAIASSGRLWDLLDSYVERGDAYLSEGVLKVIRRHGSNGDRRAALKVAKKILAQQAPKTYNACLRLLPELADNIEEEIFRSYESIL